ELLLAPAAARLRRGLQRVDELARLLADIGLGAGDLLEMGGEPAIGGLARLFDLAEPLAVFVAALPDRRDQRLARLLPLVDRPRRILLVAGEHLFGEAQERHLAALQRRAGEALHLELD